ncbi:unnamed protein product [Caenorhabditis auriculariae]|uniref:Uncharacterized protein n=1 Tax=Caenorhabditis auriculariae TaxID=2777116 RepID=A0A8S1GTM7_9PELO|nr:unnamed protein product [Caenorhabditis auriculariae]
MIRTRSICVVPENGQTSLAMVKENGEPKKDVMNDQVKDNRCVGFFHVRSLAIFIAVVEIAVVVYNASLSKWTTSSEAAVLGLATVMLLVVIALLLAAIFCRVAMLLIPHIVMQIAVVLSLFFLSSFSLYTLFFGTTLRIRLTVAPPQYSSRDEETLTAPLINSQMISSFLCGLLVLFFLIYLIIALINIWCLRVVIDCYRYISNEKLKERERESREADVYFAPHTFQMSLFPNRTVQATDF